MTLLGKLCLWELLTSLYEQMQNFDVDAMVTSIWSQQEDMPRLGRPWLWELLTSLYEQMQNFDVVAVVTSIWSHQGKIRQAVAVGTFDLFTWIDAEFQCDSNGNNGFAIYALVIAQFAFYSWKASNEK